MAKTNNDTKIPPQQQTAPETGGDVQAPEPERAPATHAQIFTFWGVVAGILAAAFLLDHFMPGTPERTIERWLMLPFGLFLAFFIYKLK